MLRCPALGELWSLILAETHLSALIITSGHKRLYFPGSLKGGLGHPETLQRLFPLCGYSGSHTWRQWLRRAEEAWSPSCLLEAAGKWSKTASWRRGGECTVLSPGIQSAVTAAQSACSDKHMQLQVHTGFRQTIQAVSMPTQEQLSNLNLSFSLQDQEPAFPPERVERPEDRALLRGSHVWPH